MLFRIILNKGKVTQARDNTLNGVIGKNTLN